MKKTVLFLFVLSILVMAGFYGSTWYGTRQALQRIKTEIADTGVLEWESITPSFAGRVRVDKLRLTLFQLNQPFRIGSAVFDAGSPQAMVRWLFDGNANWPPLAQLVLSDVRLILRPDLTKAWVTGPGADIPQWPRPWHLRACGEHVTLGGADLMAMGIDVLDMDLTLQWKHIGAGVASLRGEVNAGVLGSVDFVMDSEHLPHTIAELAGGLPRQWRSLQLMVRDGGFMRRLAAFCAQDRYGSPEDWAQVATDQLQRELAQWGVLPGTRLTALYRQWLWEGGVLALELPATPGAGLVDLEALAEYLRQEGLIILYNDKRVADVDLKLAVEAFSAARTASSPEPVTRPAKADSPDWLATPLASLSQWRDRQVRVTLASGRSLEGRLSGINERQLQVTRIVEGGEFAASADRGEVTVFEVWRRQGEIPVVPEEPTPDDDPDRSEPVADEPIY